ncbi:hypothetical protein KI387_028551, partial [Taxus chinensis]
RERLPAGLSSPASNTGERDHGIVRGFTVTSGETRGKTSPCEMAYSYVIGEIGGLVGGTNSSGTFEEGEA